jgi:hypothetical protein
MFPEIQIKRAQEKGILPPSDDFIQEPGRYDVLDLMGGKIKKEEPGLKGGIDVREIFNKGKNSQSLIVRGTTQIVEYVYDSGIILGKALGGAEEVEKRKK